MFTNIHSSTDQKQVELPPERRGGEIAYFCTSCAAI